MYEVGFKQGYCDMSLTFRALETRITLKGFVRFAMKYLL